MLPQNLLFLLSGGGGKQVQEWVGRIPRNSSRRISLHPDPGRREKIDLNFSFQTSLWCLRRFYVGLKGLHKIFEAPQKSVKIKI